MWDTWSVFNVTAESGADASHACSILYPFKDVIGCFVVYISPYIFTDIGAECNSSLLLLDMELLEELEELEELEDDELLELERLELLDDNDDDSDEEVLSALIDEELSTLRDELELLLMSDCDDEGELDDEELPSELLEEL